MVGCRGLELRLRGGVLLEMGQPFSRCYVFGSP